MTDGEVAARGLERAVERAVGSRGHERHHAAAGETSVARNLPGQGAMLEFLRVQASVPARGLLARVFGVSPLDSESRTRYEAATSEMEVGALLRGLGAGWILLHALPVGVASDIDHVVIGEGGVYIINTKSHPGQAVWASQRAFLVSGMRHPYIRNMEYEMGRAERLLASAADSVVEVSGIVAVVAARSITVRDAHRDVAVLPASAIVQWLRDRPRVLTPGDVERIGAAAVRDSTWYRGAGAVGDRHDLGRRFAAYRSQVRRAGRLQVIWAVGTTLAGAGGFLIVTYSILMSTLAALPSR